MHTTTLTVGDWSHDGHGRTEVRTILSNLTTNEIQEAYKKGAQQLDFDLIKVIEERCHRHDDSKLFSEHVVKLERAGFVVKFENELEATEECETYYPICSWDYFKIYLFMVSVGNPAFKHETIDSYKNNINIGGYDLA